MTNMQQKEIAAQIMKLAAKIAEDNPADTVTAEPKPEAEHEPKIESEPEKVELLTVKECTELVPKLSANTVRELAKQGKIESIRAGKGVRGKILVFKRSLLNLQN